MEYLRSEGNNVPHYIIGCIRRLRELGVTTNYRIVTEKSDDEKIICYWRACNRQ